MFHRTRLRNVGGYVVNENETNFVKIHKFRKKKKKIKKNALAMWSAIFS